MPQGTLAERLRAHAAGIPAFFTPTGADTAIEEGAIPQRYKEGGAENGVAINGIPKEAREFNGKRYILEPALAGDVAFIRAWKVDETGNCVFRCVNAFLHHSNINSHLPRYTSQNFSTVMAKNAKLTIVEASLTHAIGEWLIFNWLTGGENSPDWQSLTKRNSRSRYLCRPHRTSHEREAG